MWRVLLKKMAKMARWRWGRWKVVEVIKIFVEEGFLRASGEGLCNGEYG
jgi:hypothetical protein